jgi:tetratricopeptide (TPR) repeat protein
MTTRTVLLSVLFGTMSLHAQSPEQVFQTANGLFQQGKVAEARDAYESLVSKGYVSGELYHNLGNAWYRTGDIARAILNFERAMRLMPNDEDLKHNLQLMNLMITDRIEPTPRLFLWEYWEVVTGVFSLNGITWLAYLFYLVTIAAAIVMVLGFRYAVRKAALIGGVVALVLLLVSTTIFIDKWSDAGRTDEAILMAPVTSVKNSPDPRSSDAFVLHSGVKVRIVDTVASWIKVRIADGKVGWVEQGVVERI